MAAGVVVENDPPVDDKFDTKKSVADIIQRKVTLHSMQAETAAKAASAAVKNIDSTVCELCCEDGAPRVATFLLDRPMGGRGIVCALGAEVAERRNAPPRV